jgi:hypothetical protein
VTVTVRNLAELARLTAAAHGQPIEGAPACDAVDAGELDLAVIPLDDSAVNIGGRSERWRSRATGELSGGRTS